MLLDTIGAHGSDSAACVAWLGGVLRRYPQTAKLLPTVTICQLLLANLGSARVSSVKAVLESRGGEFSHIVPLAMRLAECLHEKRVGVADMQVEDGSSHAWQGVLFFLDFLGDEHEHNARTAVTALGLVLACLEKIRRDARVSETILVSSSGQGDTGSDAEEELLAGGGEEELLAGGGDSEVAMLSGGGAAVGVGEAGQLSFAPTDTRDTVGRGPGEQDSKCNEDEELPAGGGVLWLKRLMEIEDVPACVYEKLVLRLRSALMTESDVSTLIHYLEHLSQVKPVGIDALARDVADLVLRRKVLVYYLSKLPGATNVLTRIMLTALAEGSDGTRDGADSDHVKIPGGTSYAPLPVIRAGLQTLCLLSTPESNVENGVPQESTTAQRDQLMKLLVPTKTSFVELGLSDEEMTCLLQSNCERMVACAVATATPQQLVGALGLCGISAKSLAAIVARIMEQPGSSMPPMAQTLRRGFGARAVFLLRSGHAKEAKWLSDMLGIQLSTPKKLPGPKLSRQHSSKKIDISATHGSLTTHMDIESTQMPAVRKVPAREAASRVLLKVPAKTRLSQLVQADEIACAGGVQGQGTGKGL